MKKVLCIIGNVILYFVIALGLGYLAKNTIGLDVPIWEFAVALTVGWAIWQSIVYLIKRFRKRDKKAE